VIANLDFSLTFPMLSALLVAAAMPVTMAVIARLPWLSARQALQFLVGSLATIAGWGGLLVVHSAPLDFADTVVGVMILGAALLFYLEVWSLLARGYTLGLLLTLYRAGGAMEQDELARHYRGGEGLSWIMRHRLSGLVSTGLVRRDQDVITLTPALGVPVAWLFKVSLAVLGLRASR
jgi:hypothetical protein